MAIDELSKRMSFHIGSPSTKTPAGKQPPSIPVDPEISLIIGVAGHRHIRKQDVGALDASVYRVLLEITDTWKRAHDTASGTRALRVPSIILLTALAQGADQLVARQARRINMEHQDNPPFDIRVSLPMKLESYRKVLGEEQARQLDRLLAQDYPNWHEIPFCDGVTAESVVASELDQKRQYEALGVYLAQHSYILLALWDREEWKYNVDDSYKYRGGTAHVVSIKKRGCIYTPGDPKPLRNICTTGPIYHIMTPRQATEDASAKAGELRIIYPDTMICPEHLQADKETGGACGSFRGDKATQALISQLARYNCEKKLDDNDITQSIEDNLDPDLPAHVRPLGLQFAYADVLARHYQKRWYHMHYWYLLWFILAGVILNLYYYFYPFVDPAVTPFGNPSPYNKWILAALYLVTSGALLTAYLINRARQDYDKYICYRALAEALRVQFFWFAAGLPNQIADHYMRYQIGEVNWICAAQRYLMLSVPEPKGADIKLSQKQWIQGQNQYFAKKASQEHRIAEKIRKIVTPLMWLAATWFFLKVFAGPLDKTLKSGDWLAWRLSASLLEVTLACCVTILAALSGLRMLRAYSETSQRYAKMKPMYELAETKLQFLQNEKEPMTHQQQVLLEVGQTALSENADWLIMQRNRKLDLPK